MAKVNVKTLTKQFDCQGKAELCKVVNENGHVNNEMSRSVRCHTSCNDGEMCRSQLKENNPRSPIKMPNLSQAKYESNNGTYPAHLITPPKPNNIVYCKGDCSSTTAIGPYASEEDNIIQILEPHNSSSNTCLGQSPCNKLITSSLTHRSSSTVSHTMSRQTSQSPTRWQQHHGNSKPPVTYSSKPPAIYASKPPVDYPSKPSVDYSSKPALDYSSKPSVDYSSKPSVDFFSKPKLHTKASLSTSVDLKTCKLPGPLLPSTSQARAEAVKVSLATQSLSGSHYLKDTNQFGCILDDERSNACQLSRDVHNPLNSPTRSDQISLTNITKQINELSSESEMNTIFDNLPPENAADLSDASWSDYDSLSEHDDQSDDREAKCSNLQDNEHTEPQTKDKMLRIAEELLQTERDYVARLHLLHQIFFYRLEFENRTQAFLPADDLQHMFSNIESILHFHQIFLLPQLEDRIKNWENKPRIGDVMKQNAPFLKMYAEYIRNFDGAMKLINHWMKKSARFSEIIQNIQKLPECGSLSLQHHMLGPIQRVPRYELLMKDYVKHLPEDSPDMTDAKDALDLVTKAAYHSNEAMKKIETFHKLLDIYQSLRGIPVDFISPTREFVTEGPVIKIAARSGERQPRHIFLFNDLLLVCSQYNLLGTYSVRSLMEVEGMEIKPGTNTFLVRSKQKVVELDENPTDEAFGWQEKIQTVINKFKERKKVNRQDEPQQLACNTHVSESCLGKTAPIWIQDDAATMCMLCVQTFNVVRRRHHCRACGKLICKTCCKKAPLEYMKGKIERVCAICYDVIVNKQSMTTSESLVWDTCQKAKGVLHVKASDPSLMSGYLEYSEDGGHTWQVLWVTAHKDFVLYSFRAHEDIVAVSSLPLPGHDVNQVGDKPHQFYLSHKQKVICRYQTENDNQLKEWMSILEKLVKAELPDDSSNISPQPSNSSSTSDSSTTNNYTYNSHHSSSQAHCPRDSNCPLLPGDGTSNENSAGIHQ